MQLRLLVLHFILSFGFATSAFSDDTSKSTILKVETTTEELPTEILDLDDEAWNSRNDRPYEVTIELLNDNTMNRKTSGDDYAHTHGLKIAGSKKTEKGIKISLIYTTDLYTKKEGKREDDGRTPQYFTDENLSFWIKRKKINVMVLNSGPFQIAFDF